MNIFEVIILGIIQGIAEFLPISSSAHLIIVRDVLKIGVNLDANLLLALDIALHFGTLLAIIVFFFNDFMALAKEGLTKGVSTDKGKLAWYIVLATIPAALAGYFFEDIVDTTFRNNLLLVAVALIIVGILLYVVDKYSKTDQKLDKMSLKDAMIIGFAQCLALIPGFSRSGMTIMAGRSRHINKEEAAKFSFYLTLPIVLGATLLTFKDAATIDIVSNNFSIFGLGIFTAFIVGLVCIQFLLKYLRNHDFKIFMWYRIILGALVIASIIM